MLDNRATVRRVLLITLALNLVVMGIKLGVGWMTGSLSLVADAIHSLTDSANNVLGLWVSRFSSPIPDRDHPYGHQKFEALSALGIAGFLCIASFEILKSAVDRIVTPSINPMVKISAPELWIMLIVLGINIFVVFYERAEGQRVKSAFLIADAHHTLSDIWVTFSVIAGLLGVWILNWQWLDIALAFPVGLMILHSAWVVVRENLPWLVDEIAIDPKIIHDLVQSVPGVINVHDIASRGVVGRQCFVEMHLIVEAQDIQTAHAITEAVETKLESQFAPIRVLTHVEPPKYQSPQISYE